MEMGAAKVYAAARNPEAVTLTGVVPLNHSRFTYQRHDWNPYRYAPHRWRG